MIVLKSWELGFHICYLLNPTISNPHVWKLRQGQSGPEIHILKDVLTAYTASDIKRA
jgi:hypothetical protein